MGRNIKVSCGTHIVRSFDFDLDEFCEAIPTGATEDEVECAIELLKETMDDPTFADDHCRNEDAVNICIALHVLGYDAVAWLDGFWERYAKPSDVFWDSDWDRFEEHYNRVSGYLSKWGPDGNEGNALNYTIG